MSGLSIPTFQFMNSSVDLLSGRSLACNYCLWITPFLPFRISCSLASGGAPAAGCRLEEFLNGQSRGCGGRHLLHEGAERRSSAFIDRGSSPPAPCVSLTRGQPWVLFDLFIVNPYHALCLISSTACSSIILSRVAVS
jgi:hypothetical protein